MSEETQCDPTEKTLYKEPHDDHFGTWNDRLYECGNGPRKGIGIAVGGMVYVKPLKDWHGSADKIRELEKKVERYEKALKRIKLEYMDGCDCSGIAKAALTGEETK